ncbi:hypothetical protein ABW19_dt0205881 [Dactylella cylindrospora]|nr:hypothetical protein ABW19_dt0205881 [Dactylella cylindrospora]
MFSAPYPNAYYSSPHPMDWCRYIRKRYACGGEFWGARMHHCSNHSPVEPCPHPSVDSYHNIPLNCKGCARTQTATNKRNAAYNRLNNLMAAVPQDEDAIIQARADLNQREVELAFHRRVGHSE